MKLLAVFGTRPEAIKMAAVIQAFIRHPVFKIKICVTAQHRKMLDQVLSFFSIKPDYDLDIMSFDQTLSSITRAVINGLDDIYRQDKPDWVLVQGDTNTTFAASLAAFYHKIPVAHIEAGLRTHHIYSPWPEEMNRQLTSRIAALHFAPTLSAQQNLVNEGIAFTKTLVTGNTVIDTLLTTTHYLKSNQQINANVAQQFPFINHQKKLILVTSHRRENFGSMLQEVMQALLQLSTREDVQIVYPVHLNPNILKPVTTMLSGKPNIFLLEPLDYLPFVYLMMQSYLILTDSGGIQEEAPSLGKPVLVARASTERQEGINAGTAKLIGTNTAEMIKNIEELLDKTEIYGIMSTASNPYGDGKAAQRILERFQHECFPTPNPNPNI